MFLSLNRKIIYSMLTMFLIFLLIFSVTFFTTYLTKVEQDQQTSILRNQQYSDLLRKMISVSKEVAALGKEYPEIDFDKGEYSSLQMLTNEDSRLSILQKEQEEISIRSKNFDAQYQVIYDGLWIIFCSFILLSLILLFIAYLVNHIVLVPVNNISDVVRRIGQGNENLRILQRKDIKFSDEFDMLGGMFNQMLDNLQNAVSKIRENEKFLQALVDSIPDGIRVIDENYQIVLANKSYYAQSGDTRKNCRKCYASSFGFKVPCSQQHQQCPLDEILHKKCKNIRMIQQFAQNPSQHLAVNAAPLVYDKKRKYIVESIRDLSRDITFSHQQKVSSLGFLSSSIAHEMKNHLGALRIIIERLIDKYYVNKSDDDDEKKMIQMIHQELVNAVKVPERLLKLTRASNSENSEIDLVSSISDVLSLMDFEAKSKGIDIEFKKPKKKFCIYGNETDFKIAIINIVQNAIKAMPDKGILTITIKSSVDGVVLSFADTGIGISKENLGNIFTPFFSEGRQNQSNSGSGLGLAITKSIIERLGGEITVTSTLGKGSCFNFLFGIEKKLAKK